MKTIIDVYKKAVWFMGGGYNPKKFWENWGKNFIYDSSQHRIFPQHAWILKKIREDNPNTILEIGCGFGKNIKWMINNGINPKTITGSDISSSMLKNAKTYVANKNVLFKQADVRSLPYPDNSFDLVLVHAILMHVKPKDIEQAVCELSRVSKKNIIIVEQNYLPNSIFAREKSYTFVHRYKQLFKKFSLHVIDQKHTKVLNGYYLHV